MTDLLAIFVLLFSFYLTKSSTSPAPVTVTTGQTGGNTEITETVGETSGSQGLGTADNSNNQDNFDKIYQTIQHKIDESGYSDSIILEKSDAYIKFRFNDSVLFYPDSSEMRNTTFDILKYMGDILLSVNDDIASIEIGGHTATTGGKADSFFAWELSSDRALAVLRFFVNKCSLPESKMIVSGYSHYQPVASNDNEAGRSQNRRVEVKIIRTGS